MSKVIRYKVLGNSNLSDFVSFGLDLNNGDVRVRNDGDVVFIGAGGVDAVYVGPYIHSFDFTASGDSQDVLYLSGSRSDYTALNISATQLRLTNTRITLADGSNPTITMAVGSSASNSDIVVFSDAAFNTFAISGAQSSNDAAVSLGALSPVVLPGAPESSLRTPSDLSTLANRYGTHDTTIKAFGNKEGNTFATVPGGKAALVVYGGSGIDVVYVQPYTKVDAVNLDGGIDVVYLTGRFADYTITGGGNMVTLTRTQDTKVETLKVKGGRGFTGSIDSLSYDQLVFADGWLRSADVYLATLNGTLDTLRPNIEHITPGLLTGPALSLIDGVGGGATHAEATAAAGVLRVNADSGSTVSLSFTDGQGHGFTRQFTATGSPHVVTLAASDLGSGSLQLADGNITVNAFSIDTAGEQSYVQSLIFSIDGSAPGAPGMVLGANVTDTVSREEALSAALLSLTAETGSRVLVTFTDTSGHSVVRSFMVQGSEGVNTPFGIGLTANDLGTDSNQLADGTITVTAQATDLAGNEGAYTTTSFQLDSKAPALPVINVNSQFPATNISLAEASNVDGVISVRAEAGSVVSLEFQKGQTSIRRTVTGLGDAGVAVLLAGTDLGLGSSQLSDGPVTVTAFATDAAGNQSQVGSFTWVLDTAAPVAPSIVLGIGVADGATAAEASASSGVISITAEANSRVLMRFSDGTNEVIKNLNGLDNAAVRVLLTATDLALFGNNFSGSIGVRAQATDLAGNVSPETSISFTLDMRAPDAPNLALTEDSGTPADGITSNPEIRITGLETAAGTRLQYRVDGGFVQSGGAALAADGSSTLTATAGSHLYQIWQIDAAGNAGAVSSINVNYLAGPPTMQILADRISLLRGQTTTLSITFNRDIGNSLTLDDFVVDGGTLSNLLSDASHQVYTAVFTPNANSSGSASIALGAGVVTDLTGTSNVSGASISLPFNTTGPATPTLTLAAGISGGATLAEATAGTGIVSVQAESGTSVHVTFRDTLGRTVERDFAGIGTTAVWVTLAASDLGAGTSQLSKGAIQITATATNAAGNSSDIQVSAFNFDPDPPAEAVLTMASGLNSVISGTRATAAGGLFKLEAEAASTVYITLRDSPGNMVVRSFTGNGSTPVWLTLAGSEIGTGAGMLQDGAITVTAQVFDAAGNQSASNTLSFELDTRAPTPPSVPLVDTLVSRSEALGMGLTIGSDVGSQIRAVFTDQSGDTVVRDYTTGVSGTRQIFLVNTELGNGSNQLADGTITLVVTATDAAGNSSSSSSSFTLDTTAPANPTLQMGASVTDVVSRSEALAANGVVSLQAETGSTLQVTLTDTSGHSVVRSLTGRGTTAVPVVLTASDLGGATGLADGNTITVTATATDAAGNSAASSVSQTFILDISAPARPVLGLAAEAQGGATLAEASTTGTASASGGIISVRADSGSAVRVTFSDGTRTRTRNLTGTNADQWVTLAASEIGSGIGQLQDGSITVTAVATDAAGNISEAGGITFTLDTDAPLAPSTRLGSGLSGVLSRSKALQAAGVLAVSAENGSSVALTLTDADGHQIVRNIVAGASGAALVLAARELGTGSTQIDGRITVRAKATDAAGNTGPESTFTFDMDATAPNAPSIALGDGVAGVVSRSEASQAGGVLAVTAESGSAVVLTLTDRLGRQISRSMAAGASASPITLAATDLGTDTGQLSDGSISVSAVATDAVGNSSVAGRFSFTLDTTVNAPTITLGNGVNGVVSQAEAIRAGGVIRVAADAGDQVRLTFTDMQSHSVVRSFTGAGLANPLGITLSSTDLAGISGLANGSIHVRAEATDAVGNTSSAGTFSFDLDTTPTIVPSISLGAGVSGKVSRSEALLVGGVLQVAVAPADIGSWVELTLTDRLGNQIGRSFTANAANSLITLAASELGTGGGTLSDGSISVTVRATDPAGNSSSLGSFSFTLDTEVLPPSIGLGSGINGEVSRSEALQATGVLQLTAESGSTVVLTFTDPDGDTVMR
ncbi:MAG: Ig-like domain-containing protein, partial [Rhodoferax sp.]|nr:Ig-like domain-containing protein [Rhodoferax sp.]